MRSVIVPAPSFEEQNFAHEVFGRMCRYIGKKVTERVSREAAERPVWLSKQRLSGGVCKIVNEDELVDELVQQGFDVIYPETLDFEQQVALFNKRRIIAGSGSALHTAIFSQRKNMIISFQPFGLVNSNHILINRLARNRAKYIYSSVNFIDQPDQRQQFLNEMRRMAFFEEVNVEDKSRRTEAFTGLFELQSPRLLAREIAALAHEKVGLLGALQSGLR